MKFKVVIREDKEDGGYVVSCPALPGCHSQGDTIEEALENIKEAIEGCLEVLNERAKASKYEKVEEVVV
ncbi:MAG: type II toxin-antitoxin system HicB family antitoxin [Methanobacteriota archaeon]|jgi:predicted RNase H-like HicB family nuclease|nr:type II toxin-antitoxin system HicB family antitoxin [Candidatus Thermoplasmatota archaeon]